MKQLAYPLQSQEVTVHEKEIAMAVLNSLPPQSENLIIPLDPYRSEDKLFTFDFGKSRILQEEKPSKMQNDKCGKAHEVSSLLVVMSQVIVSNLERGG